MQIFFRKWHRRISILIAIPFVLTLVTGILMSTRGFNSWVQPKYPEFKANLVLGFEDILRISKSVKEAQIDSYADISQIEVRPAQGNIRVRSKRNQWEIQINGETGVITSSAPRRLSLLTSLHEGAFFGDLVRYFVFLPSAIGVLWLWFSGVFLLVKHYAKTKKTILKSRMKPGEE